MTSDQIAAVIDTFSQIAHRSDETGLLFYRRLFEIDPTTRPLFSANIENQARKLMQVLSFAVGTLQYPDELTASVRKLGVRHAYYGAREAHYDAVGQALIATLREQLGATWNEAAESGWRAAFELIASEMKAAQRRASAA